MAGIFNENGAVVRDQNGTCRGDGVAPGSRCPDPRFTTDCAITALTGGCGMSITAEMWNSVASELVALAEAFDPDGNWICDAQNNLARVFNESIGARIAALEGGGVAGGLFVTPEDHQTGLSTFSASDDTPAIISAIAQAQAENKPLFFKPGKTYTVSQVTFPDIAVYGNGSTLRADGSNPSGFVVRTQAAKVFGSLNVSISGAETSDHVIRIEQDSIWEKGSLVADTQHAKTGVYISAKGVLIDNFHCENIDNAFDIREDGTTVPMQSAFGFLSARSYRRGIFTDDNAAGWSLQGYKLTKRSPNAGYFPGNNGVLINGADYITIGDGEIDDAGEHAFRLGGHTNKHVTVGKIVARRPGGMAFKMASGGLNPSDPNTSEVYVAGVTGVDCGLGNVGNNRGLLRIAHAENFYIGPSVAYGEVSSTGAPILIQLNDVKNFTIEHADGTFGTGLYIYEGQDANGVNPGGHIENGTIRMSGTVNANTAVLVNMPTYNLNNLDIEVDVWNGGAPKLAEFGPHNLSGPVRITGKTRGGADPAIVNAPDDSRFYFDITTPRGRFIGRDGFDFRVDAPLQIAVPGMDPGNTVDKRGLVLSSVGATAGSGEYGGGVEYTGPGNGRRRVAMVPKQMSTSSADIALAIMTNPGPTATDALIDSFIFRRDGKMILRSPDGSWWACGPNNAGTWSCVAATNP